MILLANESYISNTMQGAFDTSTKLTYNNTTSQLTHPPLSNTTQGALDTYPFDTTHRLNATRHLNITHPLFLSPLPFSSHCCFQHTLFSTTCFNALFHTFVFVFATYFATHICFKTGITYTMLTIQHGKETLYEGTAVSVRQQGLLHPQDTLKINWDIFLGLLIVYSVVTTPMNLAFDSYPGSPIFDWTIDCFFFLDVIVSFNTAFYSHQHDAYIVNRRRITTNYFKFWFYVDIISSIPIDTFVVLGK